MKTCKQILLMESRNHKNLMMRKHLFVWSMLLTGLLIGCRPSSAPHSATSPSKVNQEKALEQDKNQKQEKKHKQEITLKNEKGKEKGKGKREETKIDQSVGHQVIESLSKAYGTDSTIIGDFLDSPRCPSFLEGMYFEGSILVFQVKGDTVLARQTLESAAGSGAFRLEMATPQSFTQKQLKEIMDIINTKHDKLADLSLKNNMTNWGMGSHCITVTFILNSPEARKSFREKIVNSPAVVFEGPTEPSRSYRIGVSDTLGICLRSDYPIYSTQAKQATFTLMNQSNSNLECGDSYSISYEDDKGVWRNLPIHNLFTCIAYDIKPGGTKHLSGNLYPEIHANKPGRYRFFYEVTLSDSQKNITLMAEFRLTDQNEEWKRAQR